MEERIFIQVYLKSLPLCFPKLRYRHVFFLINYLKFTLIYLVFQIHVTVCDLYVKFTLFVSILYFSANASTNSNQITQTSPTYWFKEFFSEIRFLKLEALRNPQLQVLSDHCINIKLLLSMQLGCIHSYWHVINFEKKIHIKKHWDNKKCHVQHSTNTTQLRNKKCRCFVDMLWVSKGNNKNFYNINNKKKMCLAVTWIHYDIQSDPFPNQCFTSN